MLNDFEKFQKTFSENLNKLMQHHNVSALDLGNFIGVSRAAVYLYQNNKRVPPLPRIKLIERFFGLPENELTKSELIDVKKSRINYGFKEVPLLNFEQASKFIKEGVLPDNYKKEIVFMGFEKVEQEVHFYVTYQGDYACNIENNIHIFNGDKLGINKDVKPTDGKVVYFASNDEAKIGIYCLSNNVPIIKSLDKQPSVLVDDKVDILGVVNKCMHSL